jgi:hypothetical protein
MRRGAWALATLFAAGTVALAACSRPADTNAPPGTTGSATSEGSGRQAAQPGTGLGGGLPGGGSVMGSSPATGTTTGAPVPGGSTNTKPGNAVGQRP